MSRVQKPKCEWFGHHMGKVSTRICFLKNIEKFSSRRNFPIKTKTLIRHSHWRRIWYTVYHILYNYTRMFYGWKFAYATNWSSIIKATLKYNRFFYGRKIALWAWWIIDDSYGTNLSTFEDKYNWYFEDFLRKSIKTKYFHRVPF